MIMFPAIANAYACIYTQAPIHYQRIIFCLFGDRYNELLEEMEL